LEILKSPFIDSKNQPDWRALEVALAVCSLENPLCNLHRLGKFRSDQFLFFRTFFSGRLPVYLKEFVSYTNDYFAPPEFWVSSNPGKPMQTPPILGYVLKLKEILGISYRAAWRFPAGEAIWIVCSHAEGNGADVDIMTDADREMEEKLLRMREDRTTLEVRDE
jgi:hypothetical protein